MQLNSQTFYIDLGYTPEIFPALKWNETSDGNFHALDRTSAADVHQSSFSITDTYSNLYGFIGTLAANRETFTLSCGVGEEIFGPHINYSQAISATVVNYGKLKRLSKDIWTLPLTVQAINIQTNPNVSGTNLAGSLFNIKAVRSSEADRSWDIRKHDSFNGNFAYIDHNSDVGTCNLSIQCFGNPISGTPIAQVVKAILTSTRGTAFNYPGNLGDWGETSPFGPRGSSVPTVKVTDWKIHPRESMNSWSMELTLREVR